MEVENEHQAIPFLDTLITRTGPGFPIPYQVYRKPTHTDRYLNYRWFHHPSVLRSINSTLVRRAHMVSDQEHLPGELQHLKHVLECNGYPPRHIKTNLPPRRNPTQDQPKSRVILPILGPTSQKLKRISWKGLILRWGVVPLPNSNLSSPLTRIEDPPTNNLVPNSRRFIIFNQLII